eukprot:Em0018g1199a
MSKEEVSASGDEPEGVAPSYFREVCAIDVESFPNSTKREDLNGYSNGLRLSPTLQSPLADHSPRENRIIDGSAQHGVFVVKPWCSMVLMVVVTVVVILLSRMYLFDILTWLEGLPVVESILLFVVLFTIVSFPFAFGYIVLNMMAGYLYGFVTGQFVVSVSVTFGLVISMGLCRRYFANYAQTHFTSTPFMALMKVLEGPSGLKVMVMARLTPVPFGIQNALFAMTKMDLWRCLLASVIGLTPTQLLNTYMGSTVRNMQEVLSNKADGYIILSAQVVFSVGLVFYIGRKAKMELDKLTSNEEHQNSNQISDIIV